MSSALLEAAKFAIHAGKKGGNTLPIELAGYAWLLHSGYIAIPTDKEGGFALVLRNDLVDVHTHLLSGAWYSSFGSGSTILEKTFASLSHRYLALAGEVSKVDSRISRQSISNSLDFGHKHLASRLINTIKTHKGAGAIAFRPVHASSSHCFLGLMSWVSLVISESLAKFSHLISSSDQFIKRLDNFRVGPQDFILHMDVKDLFMVGKPAFLVHHTSLIVPSKIRHVFRQALSFLLNNQYITSKIFPNQFWKVESGTGMGLRSSADVANAAFLHFVEQCGLGLLCSASRLRYGIKHYVRYFDNLLFICEPAFDKVKQLKLHLEQHLSPYRCVLGEVSSVGVAFLDLHIVKDAQYECTGKLSYHPLIKPTSLRQVLSVYSHHHSSIHGAWMKAYIHNMRKHASSLSHFRFAQSEILSRLLSGGVDRSIVDALQVATAHTFKIDIPGLSQCSSTVASTHEQARSFYLKLPFHSLYASALDKVLRNFSNHRGYRALVKQHLGSDINFRTAWCLRDPTLISLVGVL